MRTIALLSSWMLLVACSVRPVEDVDAGRGGTPGGGGHAGHAENGGGVGSGGAIGAGGVPGKGGTVGGGGNPGSGGIGDAGGQSGLGGGGRGGGLGGAAGNGGQGGKAAQGGAAGNGGQGGKAGLGGKAGQGGAAGQSCAGLETAYGKAVVVARMCNSTVTAPQCTQFVVTALSCGCTTYVNDSTELDRIKALWMAAGCTPAQICPAIACPNPEKGVCVPINSGDFCMNQS